MHNVTGARRSMKVLGFVGQQAAGTSSRCGYSKVIARRLLAHTCKSPCTAANSSSAPACTVSESPHKSVLIKEVLEYFLPVHLKVYVDCTLGAGGHAAALLQAHKELETIVGIDVDPLAHKLAAAKLQAVGSPHVKMHFCKGNYREVEHFLKGLPDGSLHGQVNGMLMDLGISSMQVDMPERGFSFLNDGPMDMRMDPDASLSAEQILNTWSEAELGRIIRDYGEEKMWRMVARRIVQAREEEPIRTTQQLVKAIGQTKIYGSGGGKKSKPGAKSIHPATRTFQALRIAVNDELNKLEQALPAAIRSLAPGGRLGVISFHSLEDRIVKHAFLRAAGRPTPDEEHLTYGEGKFAFLDELESRAVAKLVHRKAIMPSVEEMQANPRSRSAKLRVLERL